MQMAAMKQRVKHLKGSEYFPYPLYVVEIKIYAEEEDGMSQGAYFCLDVVTKLYMYVAESEKKKVVGVVF